jgi:hypothetical protein
MMVAYLIYYSAMKMEAIPSHETSVDFQQTTLRYVPKYGTLQLNGSVSKIRAGVPVLPPGYGWFPFQLLSM